MSNKLMCISDLPDEYYKGKRVLLRVDLNVPITSEGVIKEDFRIRKVLPTIKYLLERKACVILVSHLGRPDGEFVEGMSLKPIATRLSGMLDLNHVGFVNDCTGDRAKSETANMAPGTLLLLENVRFHRGETGNDPHFARELASLADIYVNDAFSTSHREHASTFGISPYFDQKLAGFLVIRETEVLDKIRENPERPFTLIIGGAKIRDKIVALSALINNADKVILGGGPAYTFMASEGTPVGNSITEPELYDTVRRISKRHFNKILLPLDHLVTKNDSSVINVAAEKIPEGYTGVDIGPETISFYTQEIMGDGKTDAAGTIFWNGPMGIFEQDISAHGTIDIARAVSIAYWRGQFTVIGGGDTAAALRKANIAETEVDFVSTGGGATLAYLGNADIPGIKILDRKKE